jgi:predicted P-loop ATPase
MPVDRHLMPVLCGAQGAGKSTAVRLLLGPVNMRVDEAADLKMLEDERQLPRLAENLVVFFDEMSKATSTDVDALKNRITAPTVKWRVLGTNTHNVRDQLATFIGASNNFVRDLIHDPSGMRRFYELNCQPKLDWVVLNSIDYAALWLSVDHTRPSPLDEHLVEVERRQDATRNQDSVEEFVEQCCIRDASGTEWIPGGLVYNEYAAWMKKQMRPPFSMTKFGRRLKVLLGEGSYKESNGMKYRLKFRFSFGSILHVVATDSQ